MLKTISHELIWVIHNKLALIEYNVFMDKNVDFIEN